MSDSGPLWPDAPLYANAAAMVHDWLISGEIFSPYEFAKRNYAQYPAFHLPYHPPVYPAMLGMVFVLTGVSYSVARIFVALCAGTAAFCMVLILRRTGVPRWPAFVCGLLLLTMPEIVLWTRDTMSEIPGLALILLATCLFLRWLDTGSDRAYVAAFTVAEAAFLSRFLTAGLIPTWIIVAVLGGKGRSLLTIRRVLPPLLFLLISGAWVIFTIRLSRFETAFGGPGPNVNYAHAFSLSIMSYYVSTLPSVVGPEALAAAAISLVLAMRRHTFQSVRVWLTCLLSYSVFVSLIGIYGERRYFIYALPAFVGFISALFMRSSQRPHVRNRIMASLLVAICLGANLTRLRRVPTGLVGYAAVGKKLSGLSEAGNILVSTPQHSDLIFRYRASKPRIERAFIRADRTLAIRPPRYTDVKAKILARTSDDVLDAVHRGRIRFITTYSPEDPRNDHFMTEEMRLLRSTLQSRSDSFQLLGTFPLTEGYSQQTERAQVAIWRYTGSLPHGPSELPVVVPTAGLEIAPHR